MFMFQAMPYWFSDKYFLNLGLKFNESWPEEVVESSERVYDKSLLCGLRSSWKSTYLCFQIFFKGTEWPTDRPPDMTGLCFFVRTLHSPLSLSFSLPASLDSSSFESSLIELVHVEAVVAVLEGFSRSKIYFCCSIRTFCVSD